MGEGRSIFRCKAPLDRDVREPHAAHFLSAPINGHQRSAPSSHVSPIRTTPCAILRV
jgi:hypothetical protein